MLRDNVIGTEKEIVSFKYIDFKGIQGNFFRG